MVKGVATRFRVGLVTGFYIFALVMGILPISTARADALISYGGTDVTGLVEEVIDLPGITAGGSDPEIPVILEIDDPGGILYFTDTTGLTFTSSDRGSRLSFTGSVSDLNNAFATLKYRTLSTGEVTVTATILPAGVVFNPSNGHMYEIVNYGESHSWDEAKIAAEGRTLNGATGYLATITTQEENDYLLGRLDGDGWFGASDADVEDDWQWVTGPEAGTSFWAGEGDGAPVSSLFSNWSSGEPNDSGDDEDCAQFYSSGSGWNDLPCSGDYLDYYVVEYGGPGDLPTVPESISFEVTVSEPSNDVMPVGSCLDLLDIADNDEIDNRYDTISLTGNIDCTGETLTSMFDDADPDFGPIGFRGIIDGNNYSITNIDIDSVGSYDVGLFSRLNDADVYDLTLSGAVVGDYCVGGLAGTVVNSRFDNISTTFGLEGYGEMGGVVGCYYGEYDGLGSFNDVTSITAANSNDGDTGGLIGQLDMEDESQLNITNVSSDSEFVDNGDNRYGGLFGDSNLDDESSLFITDFTLQSPIGMPDSSSIGGVGGEVEVDDDATVLIEDITITSFIEGYEYIGGLFGEAYTDDGIQENLILQNVHLTNNVSGQYEVGGLVGYLSGARIVDSSYTATVTGNDDYVGGLAGDAYSVEIIDSYTAGEITVYDSYLSEVGGLVGYLSESSVTGSFSTMDIDTVTGEELGGLVGYMYDSTITDSYARGDISGYTTQGGLVGYCDSGTIINSYSTGTVDGETDGGLIGQNSSCLSENAFWDTELSGSALSAGDETGKTTAEMKDVVTFLDTATEGLDEPWDFETVWGMAVTINDGYPCLQWQDEGCDATELEEETEEELEPVEDDDTDGITSVIEDSAPNEGDANNDGTSDADQNYVSSFVNPVTSSYTAVEVSDACALSSVSAEDETTKTVTDSGYDYTTGLVNFTANCGTPGYTTTVKIFAYGVSPGGLVLRKHNPVTNAYFSISDAQITQVVIDGQNVVVATYEIADGGVLDTDGQVNGVIVDPVGLASLVVSVPNTGFRR